MTSILIFSAIAKLASSNPLQQYIAPSTLASLSPNPPHLLRALTTDCPSQQTITKKLLLYNALLFLSALLLGHRLITRSLFKCLKRRPSPSNEDDSKTIAFSILGLLTSLASTIGFTYLTAIITRQPGTALNHDVWSYFQLWAIQPRPTPFIMLLGYFRGWTGNAFTLLIVDSVLSLIAIQFQGSAAIMSGEFSGEGGNWPVYRIGAVVAVVPLIFFVLVGLVMVVFVILGGACYACLMVVNLTAWCCGVKSESGPSTMPWSSKDYGWYTGYLVLFVIMQVGRWMMWSDFPSELYCPTMSQRVDFIWGLGPFGMQLVMLAVSLLGV